MKIGIDISQIVYSGTGVASYTKHLVEALLQQKKGEYILFGSSLRRKKILTDFVNSISQKGFTSKIVDFPPQLLEIVWNTLHVFSLERFIGHADVFHTSDWLEPPTRIPKVTTIHDVLVYKHPEFLPRKIVLNQRQKLSWVVKESQIVIADSESTKTDIMRYLDISETKIKVVYLGIDKSFVPQHNDAVKHVRIKYQLTPQYLLCVGTREPRKNLSRIVNAYNQLHLKDLKLVIVGNPGWGDEIKSSSSIKILNYVSGSDLVSLYTGAEGFLYPSLYEGFGLPVLEAMACGCPVITSNRGSLAEIAGRSAFIVNPLSENEISDAINSLLTMSSDKRKKMIINGQKHASTFNWENTAQQTFEVYKSLV